MDVIKIFEQLITVSPFVGLLGFLVWKIDQRSVKFRNDYILKEKSYQEEIAALNKEIKTSVSDLEKENVKNTMSLLAVIERFDDIDNTKHDQIINELRNVKQELLLKLAENK